MEKLITKEDFPRICRMCLSTNDQSKIYSINRTKVGNVGTPMLLRYGISIKIQEIDNLPKNICENCLTLLVQVYQFKKQCHLNEDLLKQLLLPTSITAAELRELEDEERRKAAVEEIIIQDESEDEEETHTSRVKVKQNGEIDQIEELFDVSQLEDAVNEGELETEDPTLSHDHSYSACKDVSPNAIQDDAELLRILEGDAPSDAPTKLSQPAKDLGAPSVPNKENEKNAINGGEFFMKGANGEKMTLCELESPLQKPPASILYKHLIKYKSSKMKIFKVVARQGNQSPKYLIKQKAKPCEPKTKSKIIQCTECRKFILERNQESHQAEHLLPKPKQQLNERTYLCDKCPRSYVHLNAFKNHTKLHHEGAAAAASCLCDICGKQVSSRGHLIAHKRTHDPTYTPKKRKPYKPRQPRKNINFNTKFICTYCGKCFLQVSRFKAHLQNHIEPAPKSSKPDSDELFECPDCEKIFKTKDTLRHHSQAHKENSFLCDLCGKGFKQSKALNQHFVTHTGEKNFQCNVCQKTYAHAASLKIHMRSHTGEKPYQCEFCGLKFSQVMNMRRHLKTHSGEKPFKCPICSKAYISKSLLADHIRSHTGERPYPCTTCNKMFISKHAVYKHVRIHHAPKNDRVGYSTQTES